MQQDVDKKTGAQVEGAEFVAPWDHSAFVKMIVECTETLPLSEKRFPETITLDGEPGKTTIGTMSNDLMRETLADPQKNERVRSGVVNLEKKLIFQKAIPGTPDNVQGTVKIMMRRTMIGERKYTKTESNPINMHTHGIEDLPPSSTDFIQVITSLDEYGGLAEIILSRSKKFLILRTLETPEMTKEDAKNKMGALKKYIRKTMEYVPKPGYLGNHSQEQIQLVLDLCREHKLALYVAEGGDKNVYKRIRF